MSDWYPECISSAYKKKPNGKMGERGEQEISCLMQCWAEQLSGVYCNLKCTGLLIEFFYFYIPIWTKITKITQAATRTLIAAVVAIRNNGHILISIKSKPIKWIFVNLQQHLSKCSQSYYTNILSGSTTKKKITEKYTLTYPFTIF